MILNRTDNPINREGRNKLNENWETLERTYKKVVDDSSEAKTTAFEAKEIAQGIDGKATEALDTANQANANSDNAVSVATQKGNESINIATQKGNESINIATQKGNESINIATQKGNIAIDIANQANNTSNYVQNQLDTVILESGDANPEVIQARADFVNLRDRLDTQFNEVTTDLAQSMLNQTQEDFVQSLANQMHIKDMFLIADNVNTVSYTIGYELADNKGITYQTAPQANDNYAILQGGRIGDLTSNYVTVDLKKYDTKTGTGFNESFLPNGYTSNVGDKLTLSFTGVEGISFNHYRDNRGGRWKFTLDNDTNNPVYVSCYSTGSHTTQTVLFTELNSSQTYTVVGEFVGDDPNNVPSDGAGTSRGWYCVSTDNNTTNYDTFFLRKKIISVSNFIQPLRNGSNKEFAFLLKRKGESYNRQYFPWHNNVVSSVKEKEHELYVDGKKVNDLVKIGDQLNNISRVEIIQYVYCKLPDDELNLGYLVSKHTFTKDGVVTVNCSFKALEDLEITDGYVNMLPVLSQFCKTLKTSLTTSYPTTRTSGYTDLANEKDNVVSYIWGNGERDDLAIAMTHINPISSLRKGKTGRRPQLVWIEHRDSIMQKLYPHVFEDTEMLKNEVFTFGAKYIMGVSPSLNNLYFML